MRMRETDKIVSCYMHFENAWFIDRLPYAQSCTAKAPRLTSAQSYLLRNLGDT